MKPNNSTQHTQDSLNFTVSQDGEKLTFMGMERLCRADYEASKQEGETETFFDWCKNSYDQVKAKDSPAFTGGEWKVSLAKWHPDGPTQGFVIRSNGKDIAACNCKTDTQIMTDAIIKEWKMELDKIFTVQEAEANARLIAEAPAMYEALKVILNWRKSHKIVTNSAKIHFDNAEAILNRINQ